MKPEYVESTLEVENTQLLAKAIRLLSQVSAHTKHNNRDTQIIRSVTEHLELPLSTNTRPPNK